MVYKPRISWKTGINPSLLATFPKNGKYTGTQKLMLVRTRIFGDKIGSAQGSGVSPFRRTSIGRALLKPHTFTILEWNRYYPWLTDVYDGIFYRTNKARKIDEKAKEKQRREDAKHLLKK